MTIEVEMRLRACEDATVDSRNMQ